MWQERWKAWVAALRARFAKKEPTVREPVEDQGIDSDYETIVVGRRGPVDWRRYALPLAVVAIAAAAATLLVLHPPLQGVGRG
jgi:hypothetical protein